jgi:hypothetical protein
VPSRLDINTIAVVADNPAVNSEQWRAERWRLASMTLIMGCSLLEHGSSRHADHIEHGSPRPGLEASALTNAQPEVRASILSNRYTSDHCHKPTLTRAGVPTNPRDHHPMQPPLFSEVEAASSLASPSTPVRLRQGTGQPPASPLSYRCLLRRSRMRALWCVQLLRPRWVDDRRW